ncbi:hypothetical protein [Vibrio mediterranei]|uniref:hypothetical protein n=1 Tax=Vibrio mediterranei TaxID=689 RepID=UPI00125F08AA|nr:hypothetical protein [Vibrio mediterranei]
MNPAHLMTLARNANLASWQPWLLALLLALLLTMGSSQAVNASQAIVGQGIQLVQVGQVTQAKSKLNQLPQPYSGEALFLAARIAEAENNWAKAMTLYREYLASNPFSVHQLEARAAFALLRAYQNDPLLGDFFTLVKLRDLNHIQQLQNTSARLYATHPQAPLAIRGQLLTAYSLLELAQQPQTALQLYLSIAADTQNADADWYIQALFGAAFAAIRANRLPQAQRSINDIQGKLNSSWGNRNSLLARSWQQRVNAMTFMLPLAQQTTVSTTPFLWGVGARLLLDNPVGSGNNFAPIWHTLTNIDLRVSSVSLWITQDSDWNWLRTDLLRGAHLHGYIPMINYWFFGDKISPEYVTANRQRYLEQIKNQLIPLLRDLPQAYLILEPEFNKQGIETWDEWDPLMLEVIQLIRKGAPQVKVGLGLGDWDKPGGTPSYASAEQAIEASDFVASMLMLSSYTERAHAAPDWSAWVRALRLGDRLKKRFNKPWMLAYLSIASQPAWEQQQAVEIEKLAFYLPMLRSLGLFALNWFSLTDEPQQQGWFAEAEQSFGLLKASYQPKPALVDYQQLINAHRNEKTPQVKQFHAKLMANRQLEIKAQLVHWTRWEVVIQQDTNTWLEKGVGDAFTIHWNGQMLPTWAENGEVSVTLVLNGTIHNSLVTNWNVPIIFHQQAFNEQVSLNRWQTWQQAPEQSIALEQLSSGIPAAIELVLKRLTSPQLEALHIGLIDQIGFQQTVSASSYAYQIGDSIAIYVPLQQFNRQWVKYIDGKPIWRDKPSGVISVVLQNSGAESVAFEVSRLNYLKP